MKSQGAAIDTLFHTFLELESVISNRIQYSYEDRTATKLQFCALHLLFTRSNSTIGEFASALHLSKSSATQLIQRLLSTGLIIRENDDCDRRIFRIHLTDKGKDEYHMLRQTMYQEVEKIFSVLPETDIEELIRIHSVLIDRLRRDEN